MSELTELRNRIEALETQAAHQERAVEDLNGVVAGQVSTIERLTRQVEWLKERVAQAESSTAAEDEPPPPHY